MGKKVNNTKIISYIDIFIKNDVTINLDKVDEGCMNIICRQYNDKEDVNFKYIDKYDNCIRYMIKFENILYIKVDSREEKIEEEEE